MNIPIPAALLAVPISLCAQEAPSGPHAAPAISDAPGRPMEYGRPGPQQGPGPMSGGMLAKIGLTKSQQDQIRAIRQKHADIRKSVAMDILAVLTPEQKDKLVLLALDPPQPAIHTRGMRPAMDEATCDRMGPGEVDPVRDNPHP